MPSGCAESEDGDAQDDAAGETGDDGVYDDDGGDGDGTASGITSAGEDGSGAGDGDDGSDPSGGGGGSGGEPGDDTGPEPMPGQLTAGEWRDLDHWDFWLALFGPESSWGTMDEHWGFSATADRVPVDLTQDGVAIADVPVELRDGDAAVVWRARTDIDGRAELFAGLVGDAPIGPLSVAVGAGENVVVVDAVEPNAPVPVEGVGLEPPPAVLDLMFVVDTTGSMGDELSFLQVELANVIEQVRDASGDQLDIRLSVNFYRDVGDEYVVRAFPFTPDVDEALAALEAQSADGGGDFEEAVEEALFDAIHGHDWSESARARLLFLVLDAPPHNEEDIRSELHGLVADAAAQGIRVIPVAGSGMDKSAEFLTRFLDIGTGGTYVFLTDHSGIGGEHLEPSIGEYQVELLNELLVRLVSEAAGFG